MVIIVALSCSIGDVKFLMNIFDEYSLIMNIQLDCMTHLYYSTHSFHADCLDANTIRYNTR